MRLARRAEKDKEFESFFADAEKNMTYLYTSDGYDYFRMSLNGISKFDLDYLRLVFVGYEYQDLSTVLSQDNHFLDKSDLKEKNINITVKYDKNSKYYGYFYMTDYS